MLGKRYTLNSRAYTLFGPIPGAELLLKQGASTYLILMVGIEIHGDRDSPFLTVTLSAILPCLQAPHDIQWRVWRLEAWSATAWTLDGLCCEAYEQAVDATLEGYPITREQMQQLAEVPAQLVNLVLLGSSNFAAVPSFDNKAALYTACEYVIEFFDSSYVIVYSVDEAFITCLRNRLAGVKTID